MRGKPETISIAEVFPPTTTAPGGRWLGSLAGRAEITGDVVGPIVAPREWDALGR